MNPNTVKFGNYYLSSGKYFGICWDPAQDFTKHNAKGKHIHLQEGWKRWAQGCIEGKLQERGAPTAARSSTRGCLPSCAGALLMSQELAVMPYLPVVGLSPQHLRSHPEGRAHQGQLPLCILHRQLHHFSGQPKVCHQRLAATRCHSDEAVLKGDHRDVARAVARKGPAATEPCAHRLQPECAADHIQIQK